MLRRLVVLMNRQFWEEDTLAEWRDLLCKEPDVILSDALGACDEAARRHEQISFRLFRELIVLQRHQRHSLGANTLEGGGRPTPSHLVPHRMAAVRVIAAAIRIGDIEPSETACARRFNEIVDLPIEELRRIAEFLEVDLPTRTILPDWSEA